jgi:predicted porin
MQRDRTANRHLAWALTAMIGSLATTASVAADVKISGYLDIGVYRGFDKAKQVGTIKRSSITVSGTEDLGGGLAATFKLQHRFEADTGALELAGKPFWHGESTVGLTGGFGQLRLGRALDVIGNNDWSFDPWYNFDRIASPAWNNWHWNYATDRVSNSGNAEYGRLNNGVFYDSPTVGGFSAHFSGAFEEGTAAGAGKGSNTGLALKYGSGPLALMVAHQKNSSGDTVAFVGAKYNLGQWTVMGAYDRSVYKAATDSVAKVISVGAVYNMGLTNLRVGYADRDVDGKGNSFLGLGADYALSKRTELYVSYGRSKPQSSSADTAYGVGMSHSF